MSATDGGLLLTEDIKHLRSAIRIGDWKLILDEYCLSWFNPLPDSGDVKVPLEGTCNVTSCADPSIAAGQYSYLFDLRKDPYEQTNLMTKYPEVAEVLELRIREYANQMVPSAWHSTDASASGSWGKQGNFITPWVSDEAYAKEAAISEGVPKSKTINY